MKSHVNDWKIKIKLTVDKNQNNSTRQFNCIKISFILNWWLENSGKKLMTAIEIIFE